MIPETRGRVFRRAISGGYFARGNVGQVTLARSWPVQLFGSARKLFNHFSRSRDSPGLIALGAFVSNKPRLAEMNFPIRPGTPPRSKFEGILAESIPWDILFYFNLPYTLPGGIPALTIGGSRNSLSPIDDYDLDDGSIFF